MALQRFMGPLLSGSQIDVPTEPLLIGPAQKFPYTITNLFLSVDRVTSLIIERNYISTFHINKCNGVLFIGKLFVPYRNILWALVAEWLTSDHQLSYQYCHGLCAPTLHCQCVIKVLGVSLVMSLELHGISFPIKSDLIQLTPCILLC